MSRPVHDPLLEFFRPYGNDPLFSGPGEHCDGVAGSLAADAGWYAAPTVEMSGAWSSGVFVPSQAVPVADSVPQPAPPPRTPRKRRRVRAAEVRREEALGELFRTLLAVAVTVVCVLGWVLSYAPLQDLALTRVPGGLSVLWPVVVYGPWLAGCLSVLRAALDGRRALHAWSVVLAFSAVATGLCVCGVAQTVPDVIVAGLPPVAAAICLDQLARQLITRHPSQRSRSRHGGRTRRGG